MVPGASWTQHKLVIPQRARIISITTLWALQGTIEACSGAGDSCAQFGSHLLLGPVPFDIVSHAMNYDTT